MTRLSMSLLGPLQVTLDGQQITGFKSNKARALLAYLAVEADQPHHREVLAGLLWPDIANTDALSNLRYTLSRLRQAIGDRTQAKDRNGEAPFLLIARNTLQFNTASDYWLDVAAFDEMVELSGPHSSAVEQLEQAVALCKGSFLEGFSVSDSAPFEEWMLFTRERIARQLTSALHRLAFIYEQQGEYEQAQSYAWRQLELEPWNETAHQLLMRTLALTGQRSVALAQYETCRRLLAKELGVEPAAETTRLYERIRDGELEASAPPPSRPPSHPAEPPAFLNEETITRVESPICVARDRELAQLNQILEPALAGQGCVAFVTGEVGSGKTTLLQEFARRAQDTHPDLVVASGDCNAHTGIGDPYLPFREVLGLLTGDVEARWAAGAISRDHACRLWSMLPFAVQAMARVGPDLIDTFVPSTALMERTVTYASDQGEWTARLHRLVEHKALLRGQDSAAMLTAASRQSALFEQYTKVLQTLALQAPLVLVVDDLQWADTGSINLLFHLGRQLAGSRILVVGAYRPEEITLGRHGERHPLEPVVNELQRDFGDITVNLRQAESQEFIDALLDSEPNRLGTPFREMLYRQTRGHPLFTVELLRGMQKRGDLVQDEKGQWAESPTLDWETLPARVEAVIAERVARLPQPLKAALRIASVEGEVFTAEVLTQVRNADEHEMLEHLSEQLDRKHRLVRAESIIRMDSGFLSRYRFRHILFQKYLYSSLDEVERVHLHKRVGTTLEELHRSQEEDVAVAVQLAHHFQEAGITEKAIRYLHQAGDRAIRLSAYQEGGVHLTKALALLLAQPDPVNEEQRTARAEKELALQISLGIASKGSGPDPVGEKALTRARELCRQTGRTAQLCQVLGELSVFPYVRAEHRRARELMEEALALAGHINDPMLIALSHWQLGFVSFCLGEFAVAREHLEQVISFYRPEEHHLLFVHVRGSDGGVSALAYYACCLWCLGYPDQALKHGQEAIDLARELGHTFSLVDVLCFGGCVFSQLCRKPQALGDYGIELARLSKRLGSSSFLGTGTCYYGEALAQTGEVQEGLAQICEGLEARRTVGARCYSSGILGALAETQTKAGQPAQGLTTLDEALAMVEETDERYCEAELYRIRGELLLEQGNETDAEASFDKAIEVARRQQARSWELRAATSLARLWQGQGRIDEARQTLGQVHDWFSEGFETHDLQEARTLLDELG